MCGRAGRGGADGRLLSQRAQTGKRRRMMRLIKKNAHAACCLADASDSVAAHGQFEFQSPAMPARICCETRCSLPQARTVLLSLSPLVVDVVS